MGDCLLVRGTFFVSAINVAHNVNCSQSNRFEWSIIWKLPKPNSTIRKFWWKLLKLKCQVFNSLAKWFSPKARYSFLFKFTFFAEIGLFQLIFQGLFKLQKLNNIGPQLNVQQECFLFLSWNHKSFFLVLKVTAKQFATSNKASQWFYNGRKDTFHKFHQRKKKLTINFAGKQGKSFIV